MNALFQQDLDNQDCENADCPGEHPVFITQRCHPGEGVDAGYEKATMSMVIFCHRCHKPICKIAVAKATVQ